MWDFSIISNFFFVLKSSLLYILEPELDMEELHEKPNEQRTKYQAKPTANDNERKLLPGYNDEVDFGNAGTSEIGDFY